MTERRRRWKRRKTPAEDEAKMLQAMPAMVMPAVTLMVVVVLVVMVLVVMMMMMEITRMGMMLRTLVRN